MLLKKLTLIACIGCTINAYSQGNGPKPVTPKQLQQINAEVNNEVTAFKKTLAGKELTKEAIAFSIDTFRLERIMEKKIDINYSTMGMNDAMFEKADGYDKLLNKYYQLLMAKIKPADKPVLVTAQKAWLAFRDAEAKLTAALTAPVYTGGGTMFSNVRVSAYTDRVVKRAVEIFNYYNELDPPLDN